MGQHGRDILESESRDLWLKEGYRNATYFYKMANADRRRNSIVRLKVGEEWICNIEK